MEDYYVKQAGSGIAPYAGRKFHRGGGFFGKILKHLKPALKYIGRRGLDTMANIGSDVLNGKDLKSSSQDQLLNTARDVLSDARTSIDEYKKKRQSGAGVKRRRRSATPAKRKKPTKKPTKKTTKNLYKRSTTNKKKSVKKLTFF